MKATVIWHRCLALAVAPLLAYGLWLPVYAASAQTAGVAAEIKIWGTAATVTASILQGAHIVRVHDVAQMLSVARVADCMLDPTLAPKH